MDDESMRRLYVAPIKAMAYDVVAKPNRSMMLSTIGAHRQPSGTRAEVYDGVGRGKKRRERGRVGAEMMA